MNDFPEKEEINGSISTFHKAVPNADLFPYPLHQDFEKRLINRRHIWATNRFWMELENMKTRRYGNKGRHRWYQLLFMLKTFKILLRLTGLYKMGMQNAANIALNEKSLYFPSLPEAFDGFSILHLSDLHLDGMNGLTERILDIVADSEVDLCVFTGDYRTQVHGIKKPVIQSLQQLVGGIKSKNGFVGVLGNHDDCHMVNSLEKIGIRMLINSTVRLNQGNDQILVIGTDDVHYYYTDQALHALEAADAGFSIALVHSPELFDMAAMMGVDLYLCGHTHAGQVCLPGGIAVLKHLNRGRKYYRGNWQYEGMQGVTNSGAGTSGIPVRFNTKGEVLLLRLHRDI